MNVVRPLEILQPKYEASESVIDDRDALGSMRARVNCGFSPGRVMIRIYAVIWTHTFPSGIGCNQVL